MELGQTISWYLTQYGCTAKTLADAAGVSPIQLSRWRSGSRKPSEEMLERLAAGISALSDGAYAQETVLAELRSALPPPQRQQQTAIGRRLDLLLSTLRIRTSEVAHVLNFDPSYLSRIRSGKRRPTNIGPITEGISRFVVRKCASDNERAAVAELIGTDAAALRDNEAYFSALLEWLRGGAYAVQTHTADVGTLLKALDDFDLNEYVRALPFDEQGLPAAPEPMPAPRTVTGLKQMMACELEFLRVTARADSTERLFIYTDMPLTEMGKDPDFPMQWMQCITALIKKGVPIEMLHNLDRPLDEIILGLELHIPNYMTGRITPYYLKEPNSGPFRHLLAVSGVAALAGEAISGHHAEGCYRLTCDASELRYYQRRAAALMEKATPLMDIYTEQRQEEYRAFRAAEAAQGYLPVRLECAAFQNITIEACHDRWTIVSKERAPRISFVIRHPKLVDAIERFAAPPAEAE